MEAQKPLSETEKNTPTPPKPTPTPPLSARMKNEWKSLSKGKKFFNALLVSGIAFFSISLGMEAPSQLSFGSSIEDTSLGAFTLMPANFKYGFQMDTVLTESGTIKQNEFFGKLLSDAGEIDFLSIEQMAAKTKKEFDVRSLRAGKDYTILKKKDGSNRITHFIYEPSPYYYIVYDFTDTLSAYKVERPITTKSKAASGIIESSLWNALVDNGMSYELAVRMEDALAWSVDFHHIQKGDRFKLIYDEEFIDGEQVGIGKLSAAYFHNSDNDYYAFFYENEKYGGYYDEEGRPMKKAFLKSPVKFSRISSRYNLRRFHPVLKRRKAHLGTDYAAPPGTPILATADGVVIKASRTHGNGNYVKIKHDKTYQTQYLHMQKFGKGIRSGVQVKQGQTIGYVGSTGLATGPHVCYRFWKNGKQVDPLRQKLPPPDPLPADQIPFYMAVKDSLMPLLEQIAFQKFEVEEIKKGVVGEKGDSSLSNP